MMHLPILQPDQRFRCEPYSCTMQASACVARQRQARSKGPRSSRNGDRNWAHSGGQDGMTKYWRCHLCPQGEAVAQELGVELPRLPMKQQLVHVSRRTAGA